MTKHKTKATQKAKQGFNLKIAFYSAIVIAFTMIAGSLFTNVSSGWYESIKPIGITPPNYVFQIVWTILYILIWISMTLSITNAKGNLKIRIIELFGINLLFNILWSFLFFNLHLVKIAFFDLILILLSTLALINICWKVSKLSSWLLLPYALWLTYAGFLNFIIAFWP
ncbi:MAG: tryptophan-rich sensory protein [Candidatus Pacearchaeota archaeon]|nr:tryptophan-rich sensory protein [Candidatus Pacearchaeota archaeon]